jgi:outer membrane protein assembly factor BamB
MASAVVFVGIHGGVFCLNRTTGQAVWSASLKGSDFVTLLLDGELLLAGTRGEVFCLDAATGQVRWHNDMPGQGLGLITLASARGASNPTPPAEKHRRDDAAAAGATSA